jgi:DNA helicase-2/ATP-dependent DNA helicase PcrA
MPSTLEFEQRYVKLNPEQKKAVDTLEGPVMVVAGPGTGKTQILALRIAQILRQTDTSPDSILALTFTESGVQSMRKRLLDIIGAPAYKVAIFTFHGFCNNVISQYPEEFPRILGGNAATDIDQIQIIEEALLASSATLLKPYGDPLYYVRPILSTLRNLKRENVGVDEYAALVKKQEQDFATIPDMYHEKGAHKGKMKGVYVDLQKKIEKNKELIELYTAYENTLRARTRWRVASHRRGQHCRGQQQPTAYPG